MRSAAECDASALRLHDCLDEVKSEPVARHVGLDVSSPIESFKQLTLIDGVNARTMVRDAETDFVRCWILSGRYLNLRFAVVFAVLDRVAQQILNALR